jgi:hypothetical protein
MIRKFLYTRRCEAQSDASETDALRRGGFSRNRAWIRRYCPTTSCRSSRLNGGSSTRRTRLIRNCRCSTHGLLVQTRPPAIPPPVGDAKAAQPGVADIVHTRRAPADTKRAGSVGATCTGSLRRATCGSGKASGSGPAGATCSGRRCRETCSGRLSSSLCGSLCGSRKG